MMKYVTAAISLFGEVSQDFQIKYLCGDSTSTEYTYKYKKGSVEKNVEV